MAGSFSDFMEKKIQNMMLNQTTFTPSSVMYIGMFTDSNTVAQHDAGTVTEWPAAWVNYARAIYTANTTNWPSASGTTAYVSNSVAIAWPAANTTGPVVVSAFGIFDASSAGNLYYWGDLTVVKSINSGDTPSFAIGAIGLTLD